MKSSKRPAITRVRCAAAPPPAAAVDVALHRALDIGYVRCSAERVLAQAHEKHEKQLLTLAKIRAELALTEDLAACAPTAARRARVKELRGMVEREARRARATADLLQCAQYAFRFVVRAHESALGDWSARAIQASKPRASSRPSSRNPTEKT